MNTAIKEKFESRFSQEPKNAPLTVDLGAAKVIKELPAREIKVSKIEITSTTDSSVNKTITADIIGLGKVILWQGPEYDKIGQWNDTDVANRIKEIYK
jgi:hypothetical protein